MKTDEKLFKLAPGQRGIISGIFDSGRGISSRLVDLGFTEGTEVECVMRSPLGDPSAYLIKGSIIALRNGDAGDVTVNLLPKFAEKRAPQEIRGSVKI